MINRDALMNDPARRHATLSQSPNTARPTRWPRGTARPVPDRVRAIARAIAAVPGTEGARRWNYADAVRTGDYWTCVLDHRGRIYIVKVHARTGTATITRQAPPPLSQQGFVE